MEIILYVSLILRYLIINYLITDNRWVEIKPAARRGQQMGYGPRRAIQYYY